jgi:hypothetical protein
MKTCTHRSLKLLFVLIGLVGTTLGPGCFQQDNNAEFKRTAPESPPPENPDLPYSEQRERKHRTSAVEKKVEAKLKEAAAKAKAKAEAAPKAP